MFKFRGLCVAILALSAVLSVVSIAPAQLRARQRVVNADQFPGADLGAKINAADRALGTAAGEIVVGGGGTISTPVVISERHTLRLSPGVYPTTTQAVPFRLKPGASIIGAGWDKSIILESTAKGQFTVIQAYHVSIDNAAADADLLVRDVQVKGANSGFNSAPQAISLGNCSRCTVDRVWVNGTRSIGIQLGASSSKGNFAQDSKVVNCLFTRVASQNLAMVNGRNILFENNKFMAPGQRDGPGSTAIDFEPNESTDRVEQVTIRNNHIDARGSELPTSGNGIVVQATTGTPYVGPILIENNTIIGGETQGVVTNVLSNAIYVFGITMRDVTIRNNTVRRTGQSGISIEGTRFVVTDNNLTDVGGGGTAGFRVSATDSRIQRNQFIYTGSGPADGRMLISKSSRGTVIENNRGFDATREP